MLDFNQAMYWFKLGRRPQGLSVQDLYPFAKISLKRPRLLKKFLKDPSRYVSARVYQAYMTCLLSQPLLHAFQRQAEADIEPVRPNNEHQPIMFYLDYQYDAKP